jgi:hypothetical protein
LDGGTGTELEALVLALALGSVEAPVAPEGRACDWGGSEAGEADEAAGLEGHEWSIWEGGMGSPSELVSIPVFGGKSTGEFIPVGNRVATGFAGYAPGLKILGRRWNAVVWAVGLLWGLAFGGQPGEEGNVREGGGEWGPEGDKRTWVVGKAKEWWWKGESGCGFCEGFERERGERLTRRLTWERERKRKNGMEEKRKWIFKK